MKILPANSTRSRPMNDEHAAPLVERRKLLSATAAAGAAILAQGVTAMQQNVKGDDRAAKASPPRIQYSLNMSTIRGQKVSVPDQVELAAKAGYDGIEPWIGELRQYADGGGSISDLKKRIADHGLKVPSAIGFAEWIVNDDTRRAAGMEQAKKDMDLVRSIGGTHIAAPPAGATKETNFNLQVAAERYRKLLELGASMEVIPELEVWGPSAVLSKLSEALFVAAEARHPQACLLLDVYHLYKGGSDFAGLRLLNGEALPCLHFNDYEATPPRESITDADRVYPGDGVAPLMQILRDLTAIGFCGYLSLELFNRTYWKEEAAAVIRIGLEKMKAAVAKAS
jgi:2-keto-myo-inositol isomerase